MKDGMKKHRMGDDMRKKKGWKGGTILPDPSELKPCKSFLILILLYFQARLTAFCLELLPAKIE
jgi:hypothetical protein